MSKPRGKTNNASKRKGGQFLSRKDDAIQWFQREGFEPAEFIGLLKSEKELDQARTDLTQLNEYCKEEVQKVVHAHHKDFLEASRNLQDVEVLVDELRNYVSGSVAVVANLVDLPSLPKQASSSSSLTAEGPNGAGQAPTTWESILALQAELMQDLQIAVAEHDVSLARALLSAGKDIIAVVDRDGTQITPPVNGDGLPAWRHAFESSLAAQKAILIEELQRELSHTKSSILERRQAAQNLGLVVGPSQATQALLGCHSLRVRAAQQHLLKQHSAAGGDPDGVEYAGGLAQRTFLAIGAAAEDVRAVFPSPTASGPGVQGLDGGGGAQVAAVLPQVAALVVQWASDEARHCASLLCRHALTPFAATGMAVGALLCVGLALVFCVSLESTHGLALRVVFAEELWPLVEVVVRRHLHRLREEASASASVDATNAALQAVAGSGSAAAPSTASGIGLALPVFAGANGLGSAPAPHPGVGGAVQDGLPDLFPRADLQLAAAVPAGLTCLPMLVPELKALAEGLASLASRPAVAVLRQGVQAIFEAVCERVHASLARLVGSGTGAGSAKEGGPQGPLLAAYVAKAEKRLRLFAESDVQAALEPLSYVCGPVAPLELLVTCLAPLNDLLSKLPEPAPDAAPAELDPAQATALQTQSSDLFNRIRAQLEADHGQGRGERNSQRSSDALGSSVGTAAAPVSSAGAGVGAPGAAAAPAAVAATMQQQPGMGSSSLPPPAPRPAREAEQPSTATALAQLATVLNEAGAQGGSQAMRSRQAGRRPPDAPTATMPPEEGGAAGHVPVGQAGGAAPGRRPVPQVATESEPELQIGRQQRRGILRPPSGRVGPTPAAVQEEEEEVSDGQAARPRSSWRERGGRSTGQGAATRIEPGDSPDEGYAPGRRRRTSPRGREKRLETTEEDPDGAGAQERQRPNRLNRACRLEAGAADELPPSSGTRTDAAAPRSRQGRGRIVRFEQLPDSAASTGESAGVSGTDEEDAPAVARGRVKPQRGAAASRGQPPSQALEKPASRSRAAAAREWEEDPADSPPPASPSHRQRPTDPQRMQAPQPETSSPRTGSRYGEADVAAPPLTGGVARRNRGAVDIDHGPRRGVSEVKPPPSSDEELPQLRRPREPQPERSRADDADDPCSIAAAGVGSKPPRSSEQTVGRLIASRDRVTEDDEAMAATRLAASGVTNASSAATPARPLSELPEAGNRPTAGGVGRKPNRFGVVLSDDEDEAAAAPRLRRPQAASAVNVAAAATSGISGGADNFADERQFRGARGGRDGASSGDAVVAVQAAAARPERRRDRLGLPKERGGVTAEEDSLLAAQNRPARYRREPVAEQQQRQQQQEGGDTCAREAPTAAAGPILQPQPRGGARPWAVPAVLDGPGEVTAGTIGGGVAGTGAEGVTSKPQTARERLAARMAAKAAAIEGLL